MKMMIYWASRRNSVYPFLVELLEFEEGVGNDHTDANASINGYQQITIGISLPRSKLVKNFRTSKMPVANLRVKVSSKNDIVCIWHYSKYVVKLVIDTA